MLEGISDIMLKMEMLVASLSIKYKYAIRILGQQISLASKSLSEESSILCVRRRRGFLSVIFFLKKH